MTLLKDNAQIKQPEQVLQGVALAPKAMEKTSNDEAEKKKAEAKKIAATAKRDFENKIKRVWNVPSNAVNKTAIVRVTLTENGLVRSIVVSSSDPDMKASIEATVRAAAPFPMPSNPEARKQVKSFTSSFWSSN